MKNLINLYLTVTQSIRKSHEYLSKKEKIMLIGIEHRARNTFNNLQKILINRSGESLCKSLYHITNERQGLLLLQLMIILYLKYKRLC